MLFAKGTEMERCEATVANKGKELEEECAINHWIVSVINRVYNVMTWNDKMQALKMISHVTKFDRNGDQFFA